MPFFFPISFNLLFALALTNLLNGEINIYPYAFEEYYGVQAPRGTQLMLKASEWEKKMRVSDLTCDLPTPRRR